MRRSVSPPGEGYTPVPPPRSPIGSYGQYRSTQPRLGPLSSTYLPASATVTNFSSLTPDKFILGSKFNWVSILRRVAMSLFRSHVSVCFILTRSTAT